MINPIALFFNLNCKTTPTPQTNNQISNPTLLANPSPTPLKR